MTVQEALDAYEHAEDVAKSCDELDALDEASNYKTATESCPDEFVLEQRELVACILIRKYMAAIGRC